MKQWFKTGFHFGLSSGVITTLGLMVGLFAGTHSTEVVLAGIITIAFADAFSDAFGIHVSQESVNGLSHREVWYATVATFLAKLVFALSFVIPILLFSLPVAMVVSLAWALLLIVSANVVIARGEKLSVLRVVGEHLLFALLVIVVTYYVGMLVSELF
jgi:VIT1/CCC1 family predicted Fe2+/Mn2+ transporter